MARNSLRTSNILRPSLILLSLLALSRPVRAQFDAPEIRATPDPVHNPIQGKYLRSAATAGSATQTSLTLSATSVGAGTTVTASARVTAGAAAISPGILLLCNATASTCTGSALLATAVLNAQGSAARTLLLPAGSYSIKASFQGTTSYAASVSAPQSLTVEPDSTYTTKASLTSVTGSKGTYALAASLSSHAGTPPGGSLVFRNTAGDVQLGSSPLGAAPLDGYQPFGLISTGAKSSPNDLAIGDFNNDGIPDIAVPNSATGVVAILLGKGDGTFANAVTYSAGAGAQPLAIAVGDFNADGNQDLAVALGNLAAVAILPSNGDGTFQTARIVTTAGSATYFPVALVVADFNHDGRLDIATANNSAGASILLGKGDGSFQPFKLLASSSGPTWIATGDFNNDGNLDLAIPTGASTVDISLGNGDGSFQAHTSIQTGAGTTPESVAAADLDDDGNVDLVVACYGANALGVLLGNGDGTFLPIELYAGGNGPISVTIGDINLDGIPDLLVTDFKGNGLTLFSGNGDGTFTPLPGYSTTTGSEPAASLVADLNADGVPELISVLYASSALYILQNGRIQGVVLKNIPLSTTGTLNLTAAYAGDTNYASSTSSAYAFTGSSTTAAAPNFAPAAGSYTSAQSVTLTSVTAGAKIYYTLDGSTPTTKSTLYAAPIPVGKSLTISALAVATGYTNSSISQAAYAIQAPAATPAFAPIGGKYTGTQTVTISSATPNATIYYTLNGSTPTTSSVRYTAPLTVSASTTVRAIATAAGSLDSSVGSASYTIVQPSSAAASGTVVPKNNRSPASSIPPRRNP